MWAWVSSWLKKLVVLIGIFCFIGSGLIINVLQFALFPLYILRRQLFRRINVKLVYLNWASEYNFILIVHTVAIYIGFTVVYTVVGASLAGQLTSHVEVGWPARLGRSCVTRYQVVIKGLLLVCKKLRHFVMNN